MQIAFPSGVAESRNGKYIKPEAFPAPLTGRVTTA